ncbi:hypothetical protein DAPPUDRAFT_254628 [Daphnia pulex]|uniref:SRCR domain-containing protein n=1 Tax=Daphnia pulex TaxID=6669 RepID=E9H7H3_DAPPU|nr:hypothetical protein DAPPUDRAFT_254628 [Daphnia pulex]|eukprot:EFX72190.1 hypothetical protein DAPPUDRAFT_254628 [Daphnia pulex]
MVVVLLDGVVSAFEFLRGNNLNLGAMNLNLNLPASVKESIRQTISQNVVVAVDRIFSFGSTREGQSECVLSDSNRGLSGQMIHSPGWTYYERKVYSVNCSSNFECPSGKCINQTSVCDGLDDCGDRSDEIVCQSQLDFQIRLAGSNKTNEGRVEVKVFGQWGAICDDHFSANDANVICRQLGFPLGASQALSHSTFGRVLQFCGGWQLPRILVHPSQNLVRIFRIFPES